MKRQIVPEVVVHFAGDSGDGMQLVGAQLTQTSAILGNDIQTFPDFPAEIRAPAGTIPGVSGFQLHFSERDIKTPGDYYDALVAMNPAALKVQLKHLKAGGLLIVDADRFEAPDLKKAGFTENPLHNEALNSYQLVPVSMTTLALKAVAPFGLSHSQARKCRNFFALGIVCWVFDRSLEPTLNWIRQKFQIDPAVLKANSEALRAGYEFAITCELFSVGYEVKPAQLPTGHYRQITGNQAFAFACVALAAQTQAKVFVGGYPITPASEILHQLSQYPHFGVQVFQAEDELSAIGAVLGAAFGGSLAITCTSGPGMDLKAETIGLAVMTELPLVIIDVQRAGPSTGMPTKAEQADLLLALYGRHGECPVPVLAPITPGDCFDTLLLAFRWALKYMTPVIVLSDAALANGAEPWQIPDIEALSLPELNYHPAGLPFAPYQRDPQTLARPWAIPGTKGLMHRLGGLEKQAGTGHISYDPDNHQQMVRLRANKVAGIAQDIPKTKISGPVQGALLVIGWGSTWGAIQTAVELLQQEGHLLSAIQLRYLNPLPSDLGGLLKNFEKVVVAELNLGQLSQVLRAKYLVDVQILSKVSGKPFLVSELVEQLQEILQVVVDV